MVIGHTADAQHAEATNAQAATSSQIANLSAMAERTLATGPAPGPSPMEKDAGAQSSSARHVAAHILAMDAIVVVGRTCHEVPDTNLRIEEASNS